MNQEQKLLSLLKDIRTRSEVDITGLWGIYEMTSEDFGVEEPVLHDLVMQLVRRMIDSGFVAGNPSGEGGSFVPWPDQSAQSVMSRIGEEWRSPRKPDFGDVWFELPRPAQA